MCRYVEVRPPASPEDGREELDRAQGIFDEVRIARSGYGTAFTSSA
jgi:hypothetical protein